MVQHINEWFLHISVCPGEVRWEVTEVPPAIDECEVQHVGAEPVIHRWRPDVGDYVQDCSALTAKRRGAEFRRLFVNEVGLLVYLRKHLIWWFGAVHRTDLDRPILYVSEDD